jgi:hypothetical protein
MISAVGTFIVSGFAGVWAWYGASALDGPPWLAPIAVLPSILIALLAVVRPRIAPQAASSTQRPFLIVVALEGIAIFVLVNLATNLGRPDLVMPAIGLVVGLHFLPLAKIFRFPAYRLTGLALSALAIGSALIAGAERAVLLGLGAAAILWLTLLFGALAKPSAATA